MNQWVVYQGEYSKQYYDVKVADGTVYENCYPSCGTFYALNGSEIPEHEIVFIKKTRGPTL